MRIVGELVGRIVVPVPPGVVTVTCSCPSPPGGRRNRRRRVDFEARRVGRAKLDRRRSGQLFAADRHRCAATSSPQRAQTGDRRRWRNDGELVSRARRALAPGSTRHVHIARPRRSRRRNRRRRIHFEARRVSGAELDRVFGQYFATDRDRRTPGFQSATRADTRNRWRWNVGELVSRARRTRATRRSSPSRAPCPSPPERSP